MRSRVRAATTAVAGVVGACASFAAAVPALAGTGGQAVTTPAWLADLNSARVAAGVQAVTENTSWTTGIQHHLTYLEKTDPSLRTGQYASDHTENPASPYYTQDGAQAGSRSNLVRNFPHYATAAVDYWWGAPFHAIGMLRPGLGQVGYADDGTQAGMDIISGLNSSLHSTTPILFPGNGSTTYLTSYSGHESPDPIETCRKAKGSADYSAPGLPIIAMLPAAPDTRLAATLTTPGGTALASSGSELCIVDEKTYTSSDTVYGSSGQQILTGDHAVLIVPRTRLVAGTYGVRITQPKQSDITWSFTVDPTLKPSPNPSSTPTTTAPTTAPTSKPTSTATTSTTTSTTATATATTTATTTATATTSTTSTTATTATTATSSAAPVALAPVAITTEVACSYGARATGSATITVTNPADGAGSASYTLDLGGQTVSTGGVGDGAEATGRFGGLPRGSAVGSVVGSDGTTTRLDVDVPTCPSYDGVRVRLKAVSHHRLRVILDNTRNATRTRFVVHVAQRSSGHRVGARDTDRFLTPLPRPARVRVYVGAHLVLRARVRP